jgi:hypothetical protein
MPCDEQVWLVAQNEGAVAGSHEGLRIGSRRTSVPKAAAVRIWPD